MFLVVIILLDYFPKLLDTNNSKRVNILSHINPFIFYISFANIINLSPVVVP